MCKGQTDQDTEADAACGQEHKQARSGTDRHLHSAGPSTGTAQAQGSDKYRGERGLSLSPPPPVAFHCPVTRSRRETDRQMEGQRHRIKAWDLLMGPGMLVLACFQGTKDGRGP